MTIRCTLDADAAILGGGFNPFDKYWSNWKSSPNGDESKKCLQPPASSPFFVTLIVLFGSEPCAVFEMRFPGCTLPCDGKLGLGTLWQAKMMSQNIGLVHTCSWFRNLKANHLGFLKLP